MKIKDIKELVKLCMLIIVCYVIYKEVLIVRESIDEIVKIIQNKSSTILEQVKNKF